MDVAVVRTRPVTADDDAFLRDLFALTHFSAGFGPPADDPVWSTLLELQYRARTGSWAQRHPEGRDRIVVADGDEVGRVWTAPDGDAVRVVDIALWPRAQGRGIGSAVMADLQRSAGEIVLTVANDNPRAAAWYRRLGYREESAGGVEQAEDLDGGRTETASRQAEIAWHLPMTSTPAGRPKAPSRGAGTNCTRRRPATIRPSSVLARRPGLAAPSRRI